MSTDLYAEVTDRIIAELERGVVPWRKPWAATDGSLHRNLVSGKPYRGVNQLLLSLSSYSSPYWVTFKQAKAKGGAVRKGEKSTLIVFWKFLRREDKATGKLTSIPMLRHYRVFNVEQCDGLTVPEPVEREDFDPIAAAETIFADMPNRPMVGFGGDRAFYAPAFDTVQLPEREAFDSAAGFYSTAFHELVHATGHQSRLNRPEVQGGASFGSEVYSREELTAEMGAAMLCAQAGILDDTVKPSAAYIGSWLKVLRADRKMVLGAAGKAQRAADYILGTGFAEEDDQ
jgi:antirestriction protein ArdC